MNRLIELAVVVLTAPFWVALVLLGMVLVRFRLGSPVFYVEQRAGQHGVPFQLIKLRSMTNERDERNELLPPDLRLTRFGRWLRASSLDEFPELFHVLTGEMALVGPRPLGCKYVERYSPEQRRRLEVRPGITGWAQIHGRNSISWERKFQLDVWYVDHRSAWLDFKILVVSVLKVLKRDGIDSANERTMPEFLGSERSGGS